MSGAATPAATIEVLVVDDERNMRTTLADILSDEGYVVETADCGEAAIDMCSRHSFDVIIMDVRMPGIDGVEAFRQLRRSQPNARVVFMSAFSLEELSRAALEEGAVAFLPKPLDVESLIKLINEIKDTAILVVEDDAGVATSLSETLRRQGYRVKLTDSPQTALELVEQIRFDVVFIDTRLPVMNGLELYLAIKRVTPMTVAVMITDEGAELEALAREAVRRTAYTFVRKPLELDHVLGLLQRITGQRPSGNYLKP